MSIFGSNFTLFKSPAQQQREQEEYKRWAFPYGEKQQKSVESLLAEVFSKKDSFVLFTFLTIKEVFEKAVEDFSTEEDATLALITGKYKIRSQILKQLKRDDWFKYLAIVLADRSVDGMCNYPSAEEILKKASQIEKLRN